MNPVLVSTPTPTMFDTTRPTPDHVPSCGAAPGVAAGSERTGAWLGPGVWAKAPVHRCPMKCTSALATALQSRLDVSAGRRSTPRPTFCDATTTVQWLGKLKRLGTKKARKKLAKVARDGDFDSVRSDPAFTTFKAQLR